MFWNDLNRIADRIGNGYGLCVLGDLNKWIGYMIRPGITGAGVPGENNNGREAVKFCVEMLLCLGNKYFQHKRLHKYTRVPRGQDGMEVKSMIDLVLVKKVRYG